MVKDKFHTVQDSHAALSNEETFLQYSLVILKHSELQKNIEERFPQFYSYKYNLISCNVFCRHL